MSKYCLICGQPNPDSHHVKARGWRDAKRCDEPYNLMDLCRFHHTECHQIGLSAMAEKYIVAAEWLEDNGWEKDDFRGKYLHEESRDEM